MIRKKFIIFQLGLVAMILVVVLGIVVPYATGSIRDVKQVNVEVSLAVVRKAIYAYYVDHRGVYPGFPGGDASKAPTEAAFIDQLLKKTTWQGEVQEDGPFGPYIRAEEEFPVNPFNNKSGVAVFVKNPKMPALESEQGWVYTAATGVFDPVTKALEGIERGNPGK